MNSVRTDWSELWRTNGERFNQWPNEDLVRWASTLERGSRVLEIGCGSGANLRALESFDLDPYGVDVAEEAVRRCMELSTGSGVKVGSAIELEFPSESFDAVCDVQCFQHLAQEDLPLAYREAVRVLKPGGQFFEVALVVGQQHFPDLVFNTRAGSEAWLKGAGLTVTYHDWFERQTHGRFYRYRVMECRKSNA